MPHFLNNLQSAKGVVVIVSSLQVVQSDVLSTRILMVENMLSAMLWVELVPSHSKQVFAKSYKFECLKVTRISNLEPSCPSIHHQCKTTV